MLVMRQVRGNDIQNWSNNAYCEMSKVLSRVDEMKVHHYRVGQVSRPMENKPIIDLVLYALADWVQRVQKAVTLFDGLYHCFCNDSIWSAICCFKAEVDYSSFSNCLLPWVGWAVVTQGWSMVNEIVQVVHNITPHTP